MIMRFSIKPILALALILMITGCGGGSNPAGPSNPPDVPPGSDITITIIAGSRTGGCTDGLGTAATFSNPRGITIDGSGNLYVIDGTTIRKLTLTEEGYYVTKIAGAYNTPGDSIGIGTAARFKDSIGITVDTNGVLYVADTGNHTIKKLTTSDGVNYQVSLLAGISGQTGSQDKTPIEANATFNLPKGICIIEDGDGPNIDNLFVTDSGNGTIRKITLYGSIDTAVSTIKGIDGENVRCGSEGITLDNQGFLYVSGIAKVQKLTHTQDGYQVDTIAGTGLGFKDGPGTEAMFNWLWGITADNDGNLYVADWWNDKIRKLTGSGINYTVSSIAKVYTPQGITADKNGNLYVTYETFIAKIRFQ
jgi:serine/threonine-protein kinase